LVDGGGMWYKVLVARYCEGAGGWGSECFFLLVEGVSED